MQYFSLLCVLQVVSVCVYVCFTQSCKILVGTKLNDVQNGYLASVFETLQHNCFR